MADTDTQDKDAADGKKKLSLSKPSKLTLNKTIEGGQVRQSFSHGRTKAVVVETVKRRPAVGEAPKPVVTAKAPAAPPANLPIFPRV